MSFRPILSVLALVALIATAALGAAGGGPTEAAGASGFRAFHGADAAAFAVPADMDLVQRFELDRFGLTYERYQQRVQGAAVLGGQVTLYRDVAGATQVVIGAHYPDLRPTSAPGLPAAEVHAIAARETGPATERRVELMIDPGDGRFFYRVDNIGFDSRWEVWIDAATGGVIQRFNTLETFDPGAPMPAGLSYHDPAGGHGAGGPHYDLAAGADYGGRYVTFDARNRSSLLYYATDANNVWNASSQTPLAYAQYHASVADEAFMVMLDTDWTADLGYVNGYQSVGNYKRNYNNAFWNGTYLVYGNGDGTTFLPFSLSLDVVAHEAAHGITDATSNLIYSGESGALNESFSDILGTLADFHNETGDWDIGEDIYIPELGGFRNMQDPAEDGDPAHYDDRYTGTADNGGVHTNSGIPNHAFYLASVELGHVLAGQIFYLGFIGLPQNATMADARAATEAIAGGVFAELPPWVDLSEYDTAAFPGALSAITAAWVAVGVGPGGAPADPPTLQSISVSPASAEIFTGQTQQFVATGHYDDLSTVDLTGDVTWSSSNESTATIAPDGMATAEGEGSTTIRATHTSSGRSGIAALTVTVAPAETITITKATYNSRKGELSVEATSSLGAETSLQVKDSSGGDIGLMTYNAKKGKWAYKASHPSHPGQLMVCSTTTSVCTDATDVGGK